jgi:GT2 family glycosyltransferase
MTHESAVSVVIPHYEDFENLDRCLSALMMQTYDGPVEIIVADNDSPSARTRLSETIAGRARYVRIRERGAGPTRNGGVAAARGDILVFTDSDCVPSRVWLAEGVSALKTFDVVGGKVDVSTADQRQVSPVEAFEMVFAFDNQLYVEQKGFSVTANLFTFRSVFDRVGPFRNGVPEDMDWCRRAARRGYRIGYAADALVTHPARRDWQELTRKWHRLGLESYNMMLAKRGGRTRWLVRTWATPLSAFVHSGRVVMSPKLDRASQRAGALAILFRLRFWRFIDGHRLMLQRRPDAGPIRSAPQ